jgi:hypothetical protein
MRPVGERSSLTPRHLGRLLPHLFSVRFILLLKINLKIRLKNKSTSLLFTVYEE